MKFFVKLGKSPSETLHIMLYAYADTVMSRARCFECCDHFKKGRTSLKDNKRSNGIAKGVSKSGFPDHIPELARKSSMQKRRGKDDEVFVDTQESKIHARLDLEAKRWKKDTVPKPREGMFEAVVME
ncbi:hypothetical protein AVEN_114597-1 [Araneus ventricosus]|uniref:Mos1 transposase HTH domain-containing protein n=1 Tax=Araneus ventricosus TaxID=182803 RepID=A0A4Y2GBE2_ARAVE|nr:hypothetical protein AVEN_114597-1 [Araneus ventricosus]